MDLGSSGGLTWGRSGQRFVSLWGGSEGWEVGAGDAVGPAEAEAEAEPPLPLVQAAGEAEAHAAVAATARAAARAGIRGVLMMGLWGFAARAFLAVPRRRVIPGIGRGEGHSKLAEHSCHVTCVCIPGVLSMHNMNTIL